MGNKTGIDKHRPYYGVTRLNPGHKSGIDLPNEASGTVPSQEWKLRNFRQKWFAGETISVAIGQGATTVTPLQIARALGGIAAGGVWHSAAPAGFLPLRSERAWHEWALNPEHVHRVIYGTYGVVNEGGTGVRAKIPGIDVCGKTGSAQIASEEYEKAQKDVKDNAPGNRRACAVLFSRRFIGWAEAAGERGCSRAISAAPTAK